MKYSIILILSPLLCFAKLRGPLDSTLSLSKMKQAAITASNTYHFQIPFYSGIAAFILFDGQVSRQASESNPIFGSTQNAKKWTDGLLLSLIPLMIYTAHDVELKNKRDRKLLNKSKIIGLQSLIIITDFLLINTIKNSSKRVRPDASDSLSFPSGHSSVSSGLSRTIFNNIENSPNSATRYGKLMKTSTFTISTFVAWGRVEAKKHHLSDVLLGNAFGAFISDFLYGLLLESNKSITTSMFINNKETQYNITYTF